MSQSVLANDASRRVLKGNLELPAGLAGPDQNFDFEAMDATAWHVDFVIEVIRHTSCYVHIRTVFRRPDEALIQIFRDAGFRSVTIPAESYTIAVRVPYGSWTDEVVRSVAAGLLARYYDAVQSRPHVSTTRRRDLETGKCLVVLELHRILNQEEQTEALFWLRHFTGVSFPKFEDDGAQLTFLIRNASHRREIVANAVMEHLCGK